MSMIQLRRASLESRLLQLMKPTLCCTSFCMQAAVDWIPRDVLAFKTKKAAEIHSSGAIVQLNSNEATITLVVPSKDNP